MKKYILILSIIIFFGWGCDDNEFLNRKPTTILMPEDVWQDNELAFSVLADLYRRLPEYQTVDFGEILPHSIWLLLRILEIIGDIKMPSGAMMNGDYGIMV